MYTEQEIEAADEILDMIVSYKLELKEFLCPFQSGLKTGAKKMRAAMEEMFNDTYHDDWIKSREISGNIGWPINIPSFGKISFRTPV